MKEKKRKRKTKKTRKNKGTWKGWVIQKSSILRDTVKVQERRETK
jgi:hypothetical protein